MLRRLLWAIPLILGCWLLMGVGDCSRSNEPPAPSGIAIEVVPAAPAPDANFRIRGATFDQSLRSEPITTTLCTLALYRGTLPRVLPAEFDPGAPNLIDHWIFEEPVQNASVSSPDQVIGADAQDTYHALMFVVGVGTPVTPVNTREPVIGPTQVVGLEFVVADCGPAPALAGSPLPVKAFLGEVPGGNLPPAVELLSGVVGEAYSQSVAAQISGGVPPFRYLLVRRDGLVGVNLSSNGVLSGIPTPASAGIHRLRIQITDSCTIPRKYIIDPTINIVANPDFCTLLELPSATSTTGTVGVPFTQDIVVSGGKTPIELNLSSGTLPPGLSLSGFTISGTPTADGDFTFQLTAQDACDIRQSAERFYTIRITDPDPCPDMAVVNGSLPDGFVGSAYSQQITISGGVLPLSFALNPGSTLPDGLFIDGNGLVSGTPTTVTPGQDFTVIVTDSCVPPQEFTRFWSIAVQDGKACPALSLSGTLPDATAGVDYDVQLNANGRPPLTYTKVSGDLPFGLGLSPSGRIQGLTFDTGIYNFDVRVVDSCPAGAQELTRSMSLRVTGPSCANLAIVTFDLAQGFEGAAYSDFINVLGGEGTLNFQVIEGALPAGLTLNQFGEIAGTAGTAGTFNFTVEVTDSCAVTQVDQQAYQLIINGTGCPGMEIDGGDLPPPTAGTPYSFTFEMFGGQGAITWMFYFASTPPPGLSLNEATGELSGTPTTPGTYFFDIEATDECDPPQHAFRSVELIVN